MDKTEAIPIVIIEEKLEQEAVAAPCEGTKSVATNVEIKKKKQWRGHRKYLWISFYTTAITALFASMVACLSYAMSDYGQFLRFYTWSLLLFYGDFLIFRQLYPRKFKKHLPRNGLVQSHFALASLLSCYLSLSGALSSLLVNAARSFSGKDVLENTFNHCIGEGSGSLGLQRCYSYIGANFSSIFAPVFLLVAAFVLRRAASKKRGSELVPMNPVPKVPAWAMATIEELDEDIEAH